jgi:predicted RNA methylase
MYRVLMSTMAVLLLVVSAASCGEATLEKETEKPRKPDVIYVPTPQEVVEKMLQMVDVKKTDIVYDLGCGDGRIVVTAAKKYGCKAWGFDIDPVRVKESLENVKENKVEDLVTIEQKDIFTLDLSKANVITLYLLPSLNVKLIPQLEKLKPGSRIVSHDFDMKGVKPDKVVECEVPEGRTHKVYLWTTPLKKENAEEEKVEQKENAEEEKVEQKEKVEDQKEEKVKDQKEE